jgi:hypothetical protein
LPLDSPLSWQPRPVCLVPYLARVDPEKPVSTDQSGVTTDSRTLNYEKNMELPHHSRRRFQSSSLSFSVPRLFLVVSPAAFSLPTYSDMAMMTCRRLSVASSMSSHNSTDYVGLLSVFRHWSHQETGHFGEQDRGAYNAGLHWRT